jgi:hypothetical protein
MIALLFPPCCIPAVSDEATDSDPNVLAALLTAPACPLVPIIPVPGPEPAVVDGRFCPVNPNSSECEAVVSGAVHLLVRVALRCSMHSLSPYRLRCSTF